MRQDDAVEAIHCASNWHETLNAVINRVGNVYLSTLEHSQFRIGRVGGIFNEFNYAAVIQVLEVYFNLWGAKRRG